MKSTPLPTLVAVLKTLASACVGLAFVAESATADDPFPAKQAHSFLRSFCVDCHSGDDADGGLRLDGLAWPAADRRGLQSWTRVFDRLAAGEMPPADAKQPPSDDKRNLLAAMRQPLIDADLASQARDGRTVLRRLNRTEYEFTLRDMLALPTLELKDGLPGDGESAGFDTVGEALTMSYVQQDAYLRAADTALHRATVLYPQPPEKTFHSVFADPPPPRPDRVYPPKPDHGLILFRNSVLDPPQWMGNSQGARFMASADGVYRLRFRARGATYDNREQGGGLNGTISPSEVPHVVLLYAEKAPFSRWLATFDLPPDRIGELQLTTQLNGGEQIRRIHASIHESGQPYGQFEKPWVGTVIALESFTAVGPIYEQWPPESHRRLFADVPTESLPRSELIKLKAVAGEPMRTLVLAPQNPQADAARLLDAFIARAFRRRPPPGETERYVRLAHDLLARGTPFVDAMRTAYQAVLCSPDFLYFQERPGRLDGEALANRLSYFLWRSLPDDALLAAARDGSLLDPQVLRTHVDRLLDDPRAERFVVDFTDQWLKLREIDATQPDAELYPEYAEDFELQDSLLRETRAYFGEMLRKNLGVRYVVDGDFAMLNRRLAQLYDIPGVDGTHIRKVTLPPDHRRGGLLTQASVLKVTANGTTTSPVTRGVWLMDRLLGSPPPAPPPDVPAIEPDIRGAVTIREQLDQHRQIAACAVCHKMIDPPGFALECFDILGGYRTRYRAVGIKPIDAVHRRVKVKYGWGLPVETGGETDAGRRFADLAEYQRILLDDQPRLARNLVERLVTFATGAAVRFGDRPDVEQIVVRLAASDFGLRSMIHEVVQSRMFGQK